MVSKNNFSHNICAFQMNIGEDGYIDEKGIEVS